MDELTYTGTIVIKKCWCGISFGIDSVLLDSYNRREQKELYCPLGHSMVPRRDREDPLKAKIASLKEANEFYREQLADSQKEKRKVSKR